MIHLPTADQRSITRAPAVLRWQPIDGEGHALDAGTVTVAVTRLDGSSVSVGSVSGDDAATRTATVPASATTAVDVLTAVWSIDGTAAATTTCEIVGGLIATPGQLAAAEPRLANGQWSTEQVRQALRETEDEFEQWCGISFRPRVCREQLTTPAQWWPTLHTSWGYTRSVRSATITPLGGTATALTAAQIASIKPDTAGLLTLTDGSCWPASAKVDVIYEHGLSGPDVALARAFMSRATERLLRPSSTLSGRATSTVTPEGSTIQLAGESEPTGNADIDRVLGQWRRFRVGIA